MSEQLTYLLSFIEGHDLFLDEYKEPYVRFDKDNHKEIWPVNSSEYRDLLEGILFNEFQISMNASNVSKIINFASNKAKLSQKMHKLSFRVALHNEAIYYDLCNQNWEVVKIDKDGYKIVKHPPILFKRNSYQKEQLIPLHTKRTIEELFNFENITEEFRFLFLITLIAMFIPEIAHPILIFYGQKGSGKSTFSRVIKSIVDPSITDTIAFPTEKELPQIINKYYLTAFDNLSRLNGNISDILCRVCTGGAFSKRELYKNDSEINYILKRCIILNGIYQLGTKNDLLDRSFIFELQPISERKRVPEKTFWESFERKKPYLLGKLFEILSKAIEIHNTTMPNTLHRLADFDEWGYAIAKGMGGRGSKFQAEYDSMVQIQNEEAVYSHPLANALTIFMKERLEWHGNANKLYGLLYATARQHKIDINNFEWPKADNALTRRLNGIKNDLKQAGIEYTHMGHKSNGSLILLKKI